MNECPQPDVACENPCPPTTKGWAANKCWASTVLITEESLDLLGIAEHADLGTIIYVPASGSPDPKVGDTISVPGKGTAVLTGVSIDHILNVLIWDESNPLNPSSGDKVYLVTFVPRRKVRTEGCATQTSTISKADAEAKALAAAQAIAAARMYYILNP